MRLGIAAIALALAACAVRRPTAEQDAPSAAPRAVLRSVSLTGGPSGEVTSPSGSLRHPAWSPDGKGIALRRGWSEVVIMDADGAHQRSYATTPLIGGLSWSPDGQWVAYLGGDRNQEPRTGVGIGAIEAATGRQVQIARGHVFEPTWMLDSRRVLMAVRTDSSADTERVTNAGTFRLKHKLLFIANALKQHYVGLEEIDDGVCSIHFGAVLLARLDELDFII